MPRYVAFRRAINGTGRFVKMAALSEHFREMGCADVQTHINSGNVLFSSTQWCADAMAPVLQSGLQARLGFAGEVFLRTAAEVRALAAPALAQAQAQRDAVGAAGEVNVIFLRGALRAGQADGVLSLRAAAAQHAAGPGCATA